MIEGRLYLILLLFVCLDRDVGGGPAHPDVFGVGQSPQHGGHGHLHGQLPVPDPDHALSVRVHRPATRDATGSGQSAS